MRWFAIALLIAAPAFAQLETNTITVTATRQINWQPDQAGFTLTVSSGTSATLDQVVAALTSLNITSGNFTGLNTSNPSALQWNFSLTVPLTNLTTTIGAITKLQQTIGQNNSGLSLSFSINGTQVSPQLQQSQSCSNSDLIADATAQAQKIASAAGVTVGPILQVSNGPYLQPAAARAVSINGDFSTPGQFVIGLVGPTAPPITCSAVVAFQMLR